LGYANPGSAAVTQFFDRQLFAAPVLGALPVGFVAIHRDLHHGASWIFGAELRSEGIPPFFKTGDDHDHHYSLSVVEMDEVTGGCIFGDLLTLGGLNDLRKAIDNQPSLPHGNPNGSSPTQSTGVNRG
jgi:hypothetical protein